MIALKNIYILFVNKLKQINIKNREAKFYFWFQLNMVERHTDRTHCETIKRVCWKGGSCLIINV